MSPAEGLHALRVLSSLNQQRAAGSFCDAVLNVGGGVVFPAHRNILACFSHLFQPNEVSGSPAAEPCTELHLQECPTDGLELLLDFVYTGELKLQQENLQQVEHAAASLGVAEAIAICKRFKENSGKVKRKRGRPKKSTSDATAPQGPVKEETLPSCSREESSCQTTTTPASTTTRSGRVVKGPRRLAPDEDPPADSNGPERDSKTGQDNPADGEGGDVIVEKPNRDQMVGGTEVQELQSAVNNSNVGQLIAAVEEDEEEETGMFEDTDEEYVPVPESGSSSAGPSSAARRRRTPTKTVKEENVEVAEEGKDSKKDSVQCPICDKSFKSKYYLKVHNRRHTGERPFGCEKCGKRYFRKENLMIHENRDCSKVKSHTCLTCSASFGGKDELRLHVFTHTGDMPHKCSTCSEQFMYKKNLTIHMMKAHGHPKPHACPQCPKTFLTRTELRVHEAAKHRGEKPFVCEECGHRASSRNGLQMHIKAIHRNERPFVCNFCGHAFSQKNNLNMHMRIHSGERPYQCHLCGKTFRTQASLDKHNRTHTGERPFGCDVCEQRFTEKGALVRHKASKHEEGRPHCCQICGKTFKAREQHRVHLRRHKGMRKFECIDCGYKFTRQAHLRRHIQIHKRTENYNPRQRKLRNVIVQDVEGNHSDNEAPETVDAALITEVSGYVPAREQTEDAGTGLSSGCIVRVVIETGGEVMEEVVTNQSQSFTVTDVPQLVPETYETTMDMEGIMENLSEGKT